MQTEHLRGRGSGFAMSTQERASEEERQDGQQNAKTENSNLFLNVCNGVVFVFVGRSFEEVLSLTVMHAHTQCLMLCSLSYSVSRARCKQMVW